MKNRGNYTKWDENFKTLINKVRKNPENLTESFREIAKQMNVTVGSVAQAWYRKGKFIEPSFGLGGRGKLLINCKNSSKGKAPAVTKSTPIGEKIISVKKMQGITIVKKLEYFIK